MDNEKREWYSNKEIYGMLVDLQGEMRQGFTEIKTMLTDYPEVRKKAHYGATKVDDLEKDIKEIKESNQWSFRAAITAILGVMGKVFYDVIARG
jgi:hypothetical protein